MALPAEVQSWADQMKAEGVSAAVIEALISEADKNEKVGNALKGSVTATSDYKKKMDLLRKQEKDAQDLVTANTALQKELVRWKRDEVDPTLTKANAIMTEQAALKAKISERAKVLKEKYGVEDADVADLLDTTAAVVTKVAKAADATVTDDGKLTKLSEDFDKVSRAMPRMAARLEKLGRQFDRLFTGTDKQFDPDQVLDLAEEKNITLDAAFAQLYDVPTRTAELANLAKEKEFADRLVKEKAAWVAQQGTQGPGTTRPGEEGAYLTDVLNRHKSKEGDSGNKGNEPPNPIDRVRQAAHPVAPAEAVSRYVSKYRTGQFKDKGIAVEAGG